MGALRRESDVLVKLFGYMKSGFTQCLLSGSCSSVRSLRSSLPPHAIAACAAIAPVPCIKVLCTPARVTALVLIAQCHHLIDRCPTVSDLIESAIDQPLKSSVLVAVDVTSEGALKGPPQQPRRLLLSEPPPCQPAYASPNRIARISRSTSVRFIATSLVTNETGQITCYKFGQFICSLHNPRF